MACVSLFNCWGPEPIVKTFALLANIVQMLLKRPRINCKKNCATCKYPADLLIFQQLYEIYTIYHVPIDTEPLSQQKNQINLNYWQHVLHKYPRSLLNMFVSFHIISNQVISYPIIPYYIIHIPSPFAFYTRLQIR